MIIKFDIEEFKTTDDPLVSFYTQVLAKAKIEFDRERYRIDITKFSINEKYAEKLNKICKRCIVKEFKGYSDRKINSQLGFYWLAYAPGEDDDLKDGEVLVLDSYLIER